MKLTARQRTFLDKLFDLYRERQGPVHYSVVAERLGVNRFSAYDMLKVLERKGVAASEYVLDAANSGPGRSMIVFYPTARAVRLLSEWASEYVNEDWKQLRDHILERLTEVRGTNPASLLNEILARLPEHRSPLVYCTEMTAALLLNLSRVRDRASAVNPLETLSALNLPGEVGLGTLAGLSLGSILADKTDVSLRDRLLACTKRYQTALLRLSEENKAALSGFLEEALAVLSPTTSRP